MFCKHKWELLSETYTESQFEHAMNHVKFDNLKSVKINNPYDPSRIFIQTFQCTKCGKLKRFTQNV